MSKDEPRDYMKFAEDRTPQHNNHQSQRVLSTNHDDVGLAGEFAFGEFSGLWPDTSLHPSGDNGIDFRVPLVFTVDVKTARKPLNLIHEEGKPFVDIYVLAGFDDDTRKAWLIGWEWGSVLKNAPTGDFGHGVINHFIAAEQLRTMDELSARLLRW